MKPKLIEQFLTCGKSSTFTACGALALDDDILK